MYFWFDSLNEEKQYHCLINISYYRKQSPLFVKVQISGNALNVNLLVPPNPSLIKIEPDNGHITDNQPPPGGGGGRGVGGT